jgi:hypothetical protein
VPIHFLFYDKGISLLFLCRLRSLDFPCCDLAARLIRPMPIFGVIGGGLRVVPAAARYAPKTVFLFRCHPIR